MAEATQFDLHGIEKQPFCDWSEEVTFLEAVTITDHGEAIRFLANDLCVDAEDLNLSSIHMRWEAWTGPDGTEYREGWLECEADHPDAVPFWKDAP